MISLQWMLRNTRPVVVTKIFSKAQIVSAMLMAINHGGNDAQKSMGVITMALLSGGLLSHFTVTLGYSFMCTCYGIRNFLWRL